jgi:hypothetical protein
MATNEDLELYYKSILIELELWHKTFIAEQKISKVDIRDKSIATLANLGGAAAYGNLYRLFDEFIKVYKEYYKL